MSEKTSAIAKIDRNQSILANYTNEQLTVIKQNIAKDASDSELIYFLQVCKAQNLDPFARQIYFVKRQGAMTIQTGIDGYRAIAEQTGTLAGIDDPIYDSEKDPRPKKATVTVYKIVKNKKVPFTASARWSEYYPGEKMGFMWNKMPFLMLGKVAEALALRKAFPKNLGNIYTEEEMQKGDFVDDIKTNADDLREKEPVEAEEGKITKIQMTELHQELSRTGKTLAGLLAHLQKEKLSDLTFAEAKLWIASLKHKPSAQPASSSPVDDGQPVSEPSANDGVVDGEIVEEMPMPEEKISPARKAMLDGKNNAKKKIENDGIIPIPKEVCELLNFYDGVPESELSDDVKRLKKDCDSGQFKGKEFYKNLF